MSNLSRETAAAIRHSHDFLDGIWTDTDVEKQIQVLLLATAGIGTNAHVSAKIRSDLTSAHNKQGYICAMQDSSPPACAARRRRRRRHSALPLLCWAFLCDLHM
jgi:hypothetical protein